MIARTSPSATPTITAKNDKIRVVLNPLKYAIYRLLTRNALEKSEATDVNHSPTPLPPFVNSIIYQLTMIQSSYNYFVVWLIVNSSTLPSSISVCNTPLSCSRSSASPF